MGKYVIADTVWEFNFPQEFKQNNFNVFKVETNDLAVHNINFELVEKIEPLKKINYEENGLKMYVEDGIRRFDIKHASKVIVRGTYENNKSTYQVLKSYRGFAYIIHMLSYMRLSELIANYDVISLHASCVTMGNKLVVIVGDNSQKMIKEWLTVIEGSELISEDKILIKLENNNFKIYTNPWNGPLGFKENAKFSLEAIVILEIGWSNVFLELPDEQKLFDLANYLGIMTDTVSNEYLMQFCLDLVEKVKILKFKGNKISANEIFTKIYFS